MGGVGVKGKSSLKWASGEIGHGETRFSGVFYSANKNALMNHSLFRHFQSTIHATVKQAKAKKALHDGCFIGSLIEGPSPVAPFWSEWQSQISKNVTTQRSERVCPRGRPRGHPAIKHSVLYPNYTK
jgi:hypothetical protein